MAGDATREGPEFLESTKLDDVFQLHYHRGTFYGYAGSCYRELQVSERS